MATKLSNLKRDLLGAAEKCGKHKAAAQFLVDISAGYALAHSKLVSDIESLENATENISVDIDFTPRIAEAIKHLPVVSEQYYTSLVRLGIIDAEITEKSATSAMSDKDALAKLYEKVEGR